MNIYDIVSNVASHIDYYKTWKNFALTCKLFHEATQDRQVIEAFLLKSGCFCSKSMTGYKIQYSNHIINNVLHIIVKASPYFNNVLHGTQIIMNGIHRDDNILHPHIDYKFKRFDNGVEMDTTRENIYSTTFMSRLKRLFMDYYEDTYNNAVKSNLLIEYSSDTDIESNTESDINESIPIIINYSDTDSEFDVDYDSDTDSGVYYDTD